MANHQIQIKLNPQNKVLVTPMKVTTKGNRTIEWTCVDGDFRVVFEGKESPFDSGDMVIRGDGRSSEQKTKTFKRKTFKYTAFVGDFFLDPELIITDDGGSGGTQKKTAKKAVKKAAKKKK